jgi:TonB family protein
MAPIVKEPETLISGQPNMEGTALAGGKAQAAAAEIAVMVNGARTVAGTNKREPFSENTSTVLVFPKGAVIRLSSAVAAGQLLFLTNEKTKKEVVCQVVKAKSEGSASGYVELQFTEPAVGFWGMRFPGSSPATSLPADARPLAPIPIPPLQPLEEKLAEVITRRVSAPARDAAKNVEHQPARAPETMPSKSENIVAPESAAGAPGIPTLSQFLSQGTAGPQLRVAEKSKPDTSESKPETSIQELKTKTHELQKSLSTHLLDPQPAKIKNPATSFQVSVIDQPAKPAEQSEQKKSLSRLLVAPPTTVNPAPGTSSFDFGADEVKIPAWLEPLARNSALSSPTQESKTRESYEVPAKSPEASNGEGKASETLVASAATGVREEFEGASAVDSADSGGTESTLSSEGPTPNFGSSLVLDRYSDGSAGAAKGSNKGLLFGLLAAGVLLAAGGGWYWYSNQPVAGSTNGTSSVKSDDVQPAAVTAPSVPSASEPTKPFASAIAPATDASHAAANLQPVHTDNKGIGTSSNLLPKSAAGDLDPSASAAKSTAPEKKPSIGKVRLAAPVVGHRAAESNAVSDSAPTLNANGVSGIDASNLGVLGKNNQPSAPLPVGGDVKPARLLSAVAPVYPQLARNQRVGGDVTIDASIDHNGHVSSTKVISGPALLHQAAIDAVRQWKYQAATLNGQPVSMHLTVTVQFKVQ